MFNKNGNILFGILDLLAQIHAKHQEPMSSTEGVRKRNTNINNEAPQANNSSPSGDYTKEQHEMCERILRCKDYYEVLRVSKEATDTEIKRSYKKLALQLHPDKNRAPGAVEAFKALGNAAGVLTDAEKRKHYDMFGGKSENISTRHYHSNHEYEHAYRGAGTGFESDFTAEELFNMFFGNGFPQTRSTSHRSRRESSVNEYTFKHIKSVKLIHFLYYSIEIVAKLLSTTSTLNPTAQSCFWFDSCIGINLNVGIIFYCGSLL